jgi:hypothetical protein
MPADKPTDKTRRDEFAMAALTALGGAFLHPRQKDRIAIARLAYAWADAMEEARAFPADQLRDLVR